VIGDRVNFDRRDNFLDDGVAPILDCGVTSPFNGVDVLDDMMAV